MVPLLRITDSVLPVPAIRFQRYYSITWSRLGWKHQRNCWSRHLVQVLDTTRLEKGKQTNETQTQWKQKIFSKSQNNVNWGLELKSGSCFSHLSYLPQIKNKEWHLYFTNFYFSSSKDYKIKIYLENQHSRYNRCRRTATKWLVRVLVKGKWNISERYISDYSLPPSISVVRRMHSGKE